MKNLDLLCSRRLSEEKYNLVLEASGLFDNFVEEMELTKTGKNAK